MLVSTFLIEVDLFRSECETGCILCAYVCVGLCVSLCECVFLLMVAAAAAQT